MYFVSTVGKHQNIRVVGYFSKYEDALEVVFKNYGDIYEAGYYPYALIENVPEGLYKYDMTPQWFKWNIDYGYQPCDTPEEYKNMVGFGVG